MSRIRTRLLLALVGCTGLLSVAAASHWPLMDFWFPEEAPPSLLQINTATKTTPAAAQRTPVATNAVPTGPVVSPVAAAASPAAPAAAEQGVLARYAEHYRAPESADPQQAEPAQQAAARAVLEVAHP